MNSNDPPTDSLDLFEDLFAPYIDPNQTSLLDPEPTAIVQTRETSTADTDNPDDPEELDPTQVALFGDEYAVWHQEWKGMPEFVQDDVTSFSSVIVHFANSRDMGAFAKLIEQPVAVTTRSVWYPKAGIGRMTDKRYISPEGTPE